MIVVLDTNIWKSSLYLKTGAAAAMRFYLHQKGARVGLPEVVRLEVEHHLRADLREIRDRIKSDHQRLLGMVGNLHEVILPDDAHIIDVVANFITGLEFDPVETSLTLEAARSSLLRTIDKIPPSHNNQQFKDGVLWADCLALAQTDDVTLVTGDKAFYQDGDIKKGLSMALLAETDNLAHRLKVVGSLSELMVDIRAPVNVSDELLVAAVNTQLQADIAGILDRLGFIRAGDPVVVRTFYATEAPSTLFVEFRLQFPCEDASAAGRTDAVLRVAGDGQYQAANEEFFGLSPTDLGMTYKTADGVQEQRGGVYIRPGGIVIGRRTVHHQVRELLDDREE
jgi:hypothetical protein